MRSSFKKNMADLELLLLRFSKEHLSKVNVVISRASGRSWTMPLIAVNPHQSEALKCHRKDITKKNEKPCLKPPSFESNVGQAWDCVLQNVELRNYGISRYHLHPSSSSSTSIASSSRWLKFISKETQPKMTLVARAPPEWRNRFRRRRSWWK